jgi:two-component system phosphate regulon sensor histidine kinase PhoR
MAPSLRRLIVIYALIFAVLASATALAYYSYSYTSEAATRERAIIEDTMRELAEEKIFGIESQIIDAEEKVFYGVDPDRLDSLKEVIDKEQAPVLSAIVLDDRLQIMPGGYVTKRDTATGKAFLEFFNQTVLPELPLRTLPFKQRGHLHATWWGPPYLFSFIRRESGGRSFYVVLEADLSHMVGQVFPQFFGVTTTRRVYQVVDDAGGMVWDFPYRSGGLAVELTFAETVDKWRLRVVQKDEGPQTAHGRRLIDAVLIGSAVTVIVAGLGLLAWAIRRERRANALKSEFITNVSHELKTPLSIISMFGEMLALGRTRSAGQATEYAEIIWRESVRLGRLIDNVLDFAKIERGADAYEFAEGDVGEVVGRALELSVHRLQKAEMVAEADVEPDLPPARIDANALTLAVLNLVDNAIKYAASGKRIELSLRREGELLVLRVRDFGPGVEPDEHDKIFDRFYRARAVRLKPIRGSGIGLALVQHIVHAHGGGVAVESVPGDGATFRMWIPVVKAASRAA